MDYKSPANTACPIASQQAYTSIRTISAQKIYLPTQVCSLICVNPLLVALGRMPPFAIFLAMFHTNSIITVAGLARMSFQAGLSNVAAYFAIVRLLGPCSVGAVYKKHQQDGKGSHDDLLSLMLRRRALLRWDLAPTDHSSHVRLRKPFRTKSELGPQLMEQYFSVFRL
jgi:hypothetical protein